MTDVVKLEGGPTIGTIKSLVKRLQEYIQPNFVSNLTTGKNFQLADENAPIHFDIIDGGISNRPFYCVTKIVLKKILWMFTFKNIVTLVAIDPVTHFNRKNGKTEIDIYVFDELIMPIVERFVSVVIKEFAVDRVVLIGSWQSGSLSRERQYLDSFQNFEEKGGGWT